MHFDAGVGTDGVAWFRSTGPQALDRPAYLFAVHGGEIAILCGGDGAGGGGFVMVGGVGVAFEDGEVSSLSLDDFEEGLEGRAAAENFIGERGAISGSLGVASEIEHPAGENVGELNEIRGEGMAVLLHDVDALPDLDPIAGEAAEGFVHAGEKCDGACAGGFAGLHHELGEEFGFFVGGHEGAGTDFDIENKGVEAFG